MLQYFLQLLPTTMLASGLESVPGLFCDRTCTAPPLHCVFDWTLVQGELELAGVTRSVTAVQDNQAGGGPLVPGPTIAVCRGDLITVELDNMLPQGGSIHWHGLYQRGSPWADGVPGVTQCPVPSNSSFPWYNFVAEPAGTYWYHSHSQYHRDDGLSGALVVREQVEVLEVEEQEEQEGEELNEKKEEAAKEPCDLTEHVIHLQEWFVSPAEDRYLGGNEEAPVALLVNGMGRAKVHDSSLPWPVFTLDPSICTSYRFRLVSAVTGHCPVILTVDQHNLTVIATDGQQVEPEVVTSLTITNGERYDFLLSTEGMEARTYVMTLAASPSPLTQCSGLAALALLRYGSSPVDQSLAPDYEAAVSVPGRHLNPLPTLALPAGQVAVEVEHLRATQELDYPGTPDHTFYLLLGDGEGGASFNNLQFPLAALEGGAPLLVEEPHSPTPPYCSPHYTEEGKVCSPSTDPSSCSCTHLLSARLGSTVEVFLVNPPSAHPVAHPVHLHGQHYSVLATQEVPDTMDPLGWVRAANQLGLIERNLELPPRKDSIQTRPGHYTLVRFRADNPGFWLLHCHISFDLIEGQVLVLKVGEEGDWSMPHGFQTACDGQ